MRIKEHMEELKKLLIVDDSEIDRTVLKNILEHEFEVFEADNGYSALNMIITEKYSFDAILLDIFMPILNGINVLRILRENGMDSLPVFMITSEATKHNIEEVAQYNIKDFIRKPFDRDVIIQRLRDGLGVSEHKFNESDMEKTRKYISDLESIYNRYITISGKNNRCDEFRAYFMSTLIKNRPVFDNEDQMDKFQIEILSRAAYLCNIGNMLLFDNLGEKELEDSDMYRQHTVMGAKLVNLNYSENCRHFVKLCSDICLHHHERYDGKGFSDGIGGSNLSIYSQICGLAEKFDELYYLRNRHDEMQFDYVADKIAKDVGFVSPDIFSLLLHSKNDIVKYYRDIDH